MLVPIDLYFPILIVPFEISVAPLTVEFNPPVLELVFETVRSTNQLKDNHADKN